MPVLAPCANCGRPTPIYRMASVILDGRVASICTRCASTEQERVAIPYAPHHDQSSIQPSTSREAW